MKFVAFERKSEGTGASRRLRNVGKTPGIVYGGEGQPQLIELDHNALWHALKKEAFHSSILDMDLAGKTAKVLLRDVQYHPFRQQVQHIEGAGCWVLGVRGTGILSSPNTYHPTPITCDGLRRFERPAAGEDGHPA